MIIYISLLNLSVIIVTLSMIDFTFATYRCITNKNNIIQEHEICNGIIDCPPEDEQDQDHKDESFALCYNKTCNDETHFRCTYGGCLDRTLRCNGPWDCWDGSDENDFECLEGSELENKYVDLYGEYEDENFFECQEGHLEWSLVCDGRADCRDGSDERATLCSAVECDPPAFRCLYGGCISPEALCNHIVDCVDGSDEMEEICLEQDTTSNVGFGGHATWDVRHCSLPDSPNSMVAENYVGNTTFLRNAKVPEGTVVRLSCSNGHRLIGEEQNVCDGDNWRHTLARCVPQCRHNASLLHIGQCTFESQLIDCEQPMLPKGTRMNVTCASGFEAETPGLQVCNADGSWDVKKKLPTCEPICGKWELKDELRSPPWLMSIFHRGYQALFAFACTATILSPYVLVTTEHCFRQISITSVAATEPLLYTVAEGYPHMRCFLPHEPHPYKLHNVSHIHITTTSNYSLALVHLLHPLEFGLRVRPVCLTNEVKNLDHWQNFANNSNQLMGEAVIIGDGRVRERYELSGVLNPNGIYHISECIEDIQRDIRETQAMGNI